MSRPIPLPTIQAIKDAGYTYHDGKLYKDGFDILANLSANTEPKVKVDGRQYKPSRIAWLLYYGCEPRGIIKHLDNNSRNFSIDNLQDGFSCSSVKKHGSVPKQVRKHNLPQYVNQDSRGSEFYYASVFFQGRNYYLGGGSLLEAHWTAYIADRLVFRPEEWRVENHHHSRLAQRDNQVLSQALHLKQSLPWFPLRSLQ